MRRGRRDQSLRRADDKRAGAGVSRLVLLKKESEMSPEKPLVPGKDSLPALADRCAGTGSGLPPLGVVRSSSRWRLDPSPWRCPNPAGAYSLSMNIPLEYAKLRC